MKILRTQQDKEQFVFWIETLRAGVLEKGTGRLNPRADEYCCLGVGVVCSAENPAMHTNSDMLHGITPCTGLGHPEWLERITQRTFTYEGETLLRLWYMNDVMGLSHPEIADIVWNELSHEL